MVRKLCSSCKKEISLDKELYSNEALKDLSTHWVSEGCDDCHYTGYKGRTAIYEIVPIDSDLSKDIKTNSSNLESSVKGYNKKSLSYKATSLVNKGMTSIEEVYSIIIEK